VESYVEFVAKFVESELVLQGRFKVVTDTGHLADGGLEGPDDVPDGLGRIR